MANIKTAISIQDSLFEKIEQLARDLKVPRSHIFVLAVEEYLKRQENLRLLAKINDAYKDAPDAGEQKRLGKMKSSHRRILEGEW
ncbi:MAG: ribbon-helix-helix protein, CopG family [Blastocatellia bacterium]